MDTLVKSPATALRDGLHEWFLRTPGNIVLEAEAERIRRMLPDLFGYHLVQVGRLAHVDLLSHSRILNRIVVEVDGAQAHELEYPWLVGSADALPVASDSVDVVLLPHILEFESKPHDALREAQRILVAQGHLLISGFNPWSLLGAWRQVLGRRPVAPWRGRFLGLNRLKDWLALLGFDVVRVDNYFFRPPFGRESLMGRLRFIESAGERACPIIGGAYLLMAKKRVSTLTPIRPRWSRRPRLAAVGIAEPSTRVARHSQSRPWRDVRPNR